jgi:hypothetical protein
MNRIHVVALAGVLIAADHGGAQFGRPIPMPRPGPVHVPHFHVPGSHGNGNGNADDSDFWIGVSVFALLCGCGYLGYRLWHQCRPSARIRITDTPQGDAPEEIRRAWIGLELPLADGQTAARTLEVTGVLSDDSRTATGYAVTGHTAVKLLESHAPAAADWWRENAPHVLVNNYQLVFHTDVCGRL